MGFSFQSTIPSFKSNWKLARPSYADYAKYFALYRVSFSRAVLSQHDSPGPISREPRILTSNLDVSITFEANLTSACELVIMFCYDSELSLSRTSESNRTFSMDYTL